MGIIRSVLVLLVGAALATFLWSNYDQRVVIFFTAWFRSVEIPLSAALVGALGAGFLLAVVLSLPNQIRLRSRVRELNRKVERLENELAELRKLPLADVPESSGTLPERISSETGSMGSKPVS